MSVYANGLQLNLNEVALMEFSENGSNNPVARIAVTYETFKLFYQLMGQAIEQHDKKLHELQRSKQNMN